MMGGDVSVQSEAGRGSTFTLRLPAEVPAPTAEADKTVKQAAGPTAPAARASDGRATILVVDDDADARALATHVLSSEGYDVITAADGPEGLRLAREHHPTAITLDVLMPQMDGWAVLSSLKSDPDLADVPVIMVTMTGDRNLGYALGAADFMTKPIDRARLAAVLRRYACRKPMCRVLIVDDDPTSLALLGPTLEAEGWAVDAANSGEVALRRVAEERPDLILLDLMMPGMSGFEVAAELQRTPAWRSIPVVVMTAKDLSDDDRRRLNGLVGRVLQKGPDAKDGLLQAIGDLTSICALTRASTP
jgi:CheY-like chemotaxis protein